MFKRPHHRRVAQALQALDGDLLAAHACWFGGGTAMAFAIDVTNKASIAKMVEGVMTAWGRIDTLVNNAGIVQDAQFKKMSEDQFDRVIDVNLKGVYNCTKAVVDVMLEQNSGCILNASSITQSNEWNHWSA